MLRRGEIENAPRLKRWNGGRHALFLCGHVSICNGVWGLYRYQTRFQFLDSESHLFVIHNIMVFDPWGRAVSYSIGL